MLNFLAAAREAPHRLCACERARAEDDGTGKGMAAWQGDATLRVVTERGWKRTGEPRIRAKERLPCVQGEIKEKPTSHRQRV